MYLHQDPPHWRGSGSPSRHCKSLALAWSETNFPRSACRSTSGLVQSSRRAFRTWHVPSRIDPMRLLCLVILLIAIPAAAAPDPEPAPILRGTPEASEPTADEVKAFLRQLAEYVRDHHLKRDPDSPQKG